jgi:hypothetical protein
MNEAEIEKMYRDQGLTDMDLFEMFMKVYEQQNQGDSFLFVHMAWMEFTGKSICKEKGYPAAFHDFWEWLANPILYNQNHRVPTWDETHPVVSYRDCNTGDLLYYKEGETQTIIACTYQSNGWAKTDTGVLIRSTKFRKRAEGEKTMRAEDAF